MQIYSYSTSVKPVYFSVCGSPLIPRRTLLPEFNIRSLLSFVGCFLEKEGKRKRDRKRKPPTLQHWRLCKIFASVLRVVKKNKKTPTKQFQNKKFFQIRKIRQSSWAMTKQNLRTSSKFTHTCRYILTYVYIHQYIHDCTLLLPHGRVPSKTHPNEGTSWVLPAHIRGNVLPHSSQVPSPQERVSGNGRPGHSKVICTKNQSGGDQIPAWDP